MEIQCPLLAPPPFILCKYNSKEEGTKRAGAGFELTLPRSFAFGTNKNRSTTHSSDKAITMATINFASLLETFVKAKDYYLAADLGKLLKPEDSFWVANTYPGISNKKKSAARSIIKGFKNVLLGNKIIVSDTYHGLLKEKYTSEKGCWENAASFTELIILAEKRRLSVSAEAVKVKSTNVVAALDELTYDKLMTNLELATIRTMHTPMMEALPPPYSEVAEDPPVIVEREDTPETANNLPEYVNYIKSALMDLPPWISPEQDAAIEELKTILPSCESVRMINEAVRGKLSPVGMEISHGQLMMKIINLSGEPDDDNDDDDDGTDSEDNSLGPLNTPPSSQRFVNTSQVLKEFWETTEYTKFDIMQKGVAVMEHDFNLANVAYFMSENTLDNNEIRDISFAVIIVKLASVGLITANRDSVVPPAVTAGNIGMLSERKLITLEPLAKTMAIVALHAYSQGVSDDVISWYNSFSAVRGTFLSEMRFTMIAKLVIYSHRFPEIMNLITVADVLSASNVLKYRVTRLSTPSLVKKALGVMPFGVVYAKFKVAEVEAYAKFEKGGILAQIAVGPLAAYCLGEFDTLGSAVIPSNTPLSSLKAIEKAPYFPSTIKKSKMILDVMKFDYGRWYQGEKAAKDMDSEDFIFLSLVKAIARSTREKTVDATVDYEGFENYHKITKTVEERKMKKVISEWI